MEVDSTNELELLEMYLELTEKQEELIKYCNKCINSL